MVLQIPGLGAARVLQLGIGLEDAGVLGRLAQINAQAGALGVTFGDTAQSAQLVQAQLALLGFTAAGVTASFSKAFAEFERTTTLAAFAAEESAKGGIAALEGIQKQALDLASDMKLSADEAATLTQQIAQLGLNSREQITTLSRAAAAIEIMGETSAPDAAEAIFRLANIVSDTDEEFNHLMDNSAGLASAIQVVADASAAGVDGMFEFMRKLQAAGVAANFTAQEMIAIAGAVTDVDEGVREKVTSSIIRIFSTIIPQGSEAFRDFFKEFAVGLSETQRQILATEEGLQRAFAEEPIVILKGLASGFIELQRQLENSTLSFEEQEQVRRALGLDNVRDIQTLATLGANYEKLTKFVGDANAEFAAAVEGGEEGTELFKRHTALLSQLQGGWQSLRVEMEKFAIVGGEMLRDILLPLIRGLTGLAEQINKNESLVRMLTLAFTVLPAAVVVTGALKLVKAMKPVAALMGFLGGGRAAAAAVRGETTIAGAIAQEVPREVRARSFGRISGALGQILAPTLRGAIVEGGDGASRSIREGIEEAVQRLPEEMQKVLDDIGDFAIRRELEARAVKRGRVANAIKNPFAALGVLLGVNQFGRDSPAILRKGAADQLAISKALQGAGAATLGEGFTTEVSRVRGDKFVKQTIRGKALDELIGKGVAKELGITSIELDRLGGTVKIRGTRGQFLGAGARAETAAIIRRGGGGPIAQMEDMVARRILGGDPGQLQAIESVREGVFPTAKAIERQAKLAEQARGIPLFGPAIARRLRSPRAFQKVFDRGGSGLGSRALALAGRRGGITGGIASLLLGAGSPTIGAIAGTSLAGSVAQRGFVAGAQRLGISAAVAGPIGPILSTIGLLTPAFRKLADVLDDLGSERDGALGLFIGGLELVFRLLQTVGNIVEFVFDAVFFGLRKIFNELARIPFIGELFEGMNFTVDSFNDALKRLNESLESGRNELRGQLDAPPINNVEVNIQGSDTGDAAKDAIRRHLADTT